MPVFIIIAAVFAYQIYVPANAGAWSRPGDSGYIAIKRSHVSGAAAIAVPQQIGATASGLETQTSANSQTREIFGEYKVPNFNTKEGKEIIKSMVTIAGLTRNGFISGDLSTVMSPRTVITWAENTNIIDDIDLAFKLTFFNKCDEMERPIVSEYYQRCFGRDLMEIENKTEI